MMTPEAKSQQNIRQIEANLDLRVRARQGRRAAFEALVCRYQDRLFNTVYRLLGNAEDARDVVQEAFLNAFQSLDSFKGDSQFYTWLYRIAFNAAVSLKRKQHVALSMHGTEDRGEVEPPDPSAYSQPDHALQRAEEKRRVQQALVRLSSEYRAVLIMKDMDGQKYETMAKALGVPIGTIRSRLHRARLELRELLRQDEEKGR
jgi:RNA polymerase sigma-70 factor (ECF subfamily)